MDKAHTQLTCELVDDDEVRVRITNLPPDSDGDAREDIEITLAFYSDTEKLELSIETRADSLVTAEFQRASDLSLRFEDIENPFTDDTPCCGACYGSDCDCDESCNEATKDEGCHQHCSHYPDIRCCDCGTVDQEW